MLRLLALLSASALGADYMDCGSTALCGVVVLESGYGEGAYAAAAPGVHGLWPETDAYGSSACVAPSGSAATPTTVYPCYDDTDDPDADLGFEQHEWGKHGVCAGVADADDYFTQLCAIAAGPLAAMRAAREAGADLDAMADAVEGAGYSVFYVDDSSDSQLYLSACATSNGTWRLAAPSAFESVCGAWSAAGGDDAPAGDDGGAATCEPSELGPECAYDEETAGTADDPCLAYSNCVRCAKTTHGGAHYCTDVAA